MRLRAINIFSAYLGDEEETKARTRLLRQEADFLDDEFCCKVKFYDNEFCKQLNLECDGKSKEMSIGKIGLSEGYIFRGPRAVLVDNKGRLFAVKITHL